MGHREAGKGEKWRRERGSTVRSVSTKKERNIGKRDTESQTDEALSETKKKTGREIIEFCLSESCVCYSSSSSFSSSFLSSFSFTSSSFLFSPPSQHPTPPPSPLSPITVTFFSLPAHSLLTPLLPLPVFPLTCYPHEDSP